MLAEMNAVTERVQRTCPKCGAAVGDRVDWCGQCYTRLRITVPQSDIQRVTAMNPRLGNIDTGSRRRSLRASLGNLRIVATRIAMTLGVAYGVAWCAFNLKPQWYAASIAGAGYTVWTIWRSGRRYA